MLVEHVGLSYFTKWKDNAVWVEHVGRDIFTRRENRVLVEHVGNEILKAKKTEFLVLAAMGTTLGLTWS